MANKQALRELQTRLAERLQAVRAEKPGQSWLAIEAGGHDLLLPLQQAGEIFDPGTVVPVPHTQPWLMGVVNLRGGVYTVVDLARFLGVRTGAAVPRRADGARLLAFNASLGMNVALLVDRLLGLRHAADMQREDEVDGTVRPAFAAAAWRDAGERRWQELSLAALAHTPEFLAIGG